MSDTLDDRLEQAYAEELELATGGGRQMAMMIQGALMMQFQMGGTAPGTEGFFKALKIAHIHQPQDEDGNYLNHFFVTFESGAKIKLTLEAVL